MTQVGTNQKELQIKFKKSAESKCWVAEIFCNKCMVWKKSDFDSLNSFSINFFGIEERE